MQSQASARLPTSLPRTVPLACLAPWRLWHASPWHRRRRRRRRPDRTLLTSDAAAAEQGGQPEWGAPVGGNQEWREQVDAAQPGRRKSSQAATPGR
jgi:hypothetical protein